MDYYILELNLWFTVYELQNVFGNNFQVTMYVLMRQTRT
jgi:hypothetical protein